MKQGIGAFTMSTAVLREDACIIDEQDGHLVLTLRISKETILRNHGLLAALSDAVSGSVPLRTPPPSHRARKTPHWVYATLICVALAVPCPFIGNTFAGYPPPVQIKSVTATKPVFKVGESIEIDFVYSRDRVCMTTFDHLIERNENEAAIFNLRAYGASNPPTHGEFEHFHLALKPPTPLPPGHYIYVGYNHSQCAEGGTYDIAYPRVEFTVVEVTSS